MVTEQTTLMQLAEVVEDYARLQEEKKRIEMSLGIAKNSIMEAFKVTSMRSYQTGNLIARIDTRVSKFISVKEAQELLDKGIFNKLCRESISVVLSVRQVKQQAEEHYGKQE